MKPIVKVLIWALIFIAVLTAAYFAYQRLQGDFSPIEQGSSLPLEEGSSEVEQERLPKAPDFTVTDMEGNAVSLKDFAGKPTVLNFWATWCGICDGEMGGFEAIYQEYGDRVNFMMINLTDGQQETKEIVEAYLEENGYTFPVYLDEEMDAMLKYGAFYIPLTVFINTEGEIAYAQNSMIGKGQLQTQIEALLK